MVLLLYSLVNQSIKDTPEVRRKEWQTAAVHSSEGSMWVRGAFCAPLSSSLCHMANSKAKGKVRLVWGESRVWAHDLLEVGRMK